MDKTAQVLLKKYALEIEKRRNEFSEVAHNASFAVSRHNEVAGLELVVMRSESEVHYHTNLAYFCFINPGLLTLGAFDRNGIAHVSKHVTVRLHVYPIPSYVLHAVGPTSENQSAELLIFTPSGDRPREDAYPDDTFFLKHLVLE